MARLSASCIELDVTIHLPDMPPSTAPEVFSFFENLPNLLA